MTPAIKNIILHALDHMRGDDLERAERAFQGKTPEQLQEQFGQSGRTCQQILDEYRKGREEINAAIAEVKSL